MKLGGKYNWKHQSERLVYMGRNWSGNGYWHQFSLVDEPGTVWCEVLDADLSMIEETAGAESFPALPKQGRSFICTKCQSKECTAGEEDREYPVCKRCGYLGFAGNLGYSMAQMIDYGKACVAAYVAEQSAKPPKE